MDRKILYERLLKREKDSNILVGKDIAIISFQIKQKNKFEILLVRTKKGALFKEDSHPVHAAFIVVTSPDEKGFYLHSLMWMLKISEAPEFHKKWMDAKNKNKLRKIVLDAYLKYCINGNGKKKRD